MVCLYVTLPGVTRVTCQRLWRTGYPPGEYLINPDYTDDYIHVECNNGRTIFRHNQPASKNYIFGRDIKYINAIAVSDMKKIIKISANCKQYMMYNCTIDQGIASPSLPKLQDNSAYWTNYINESIYVWGAWDVTGGCECHKNNSCNYTG